MAGYVQDYWLYLKVELKKLKVYFYNEFVGFWCMAATSSLVIHVRIEQKKSVCMFSSPTAVMAVACLCRMRSFYAIGGIQIFGLKTFGQT